MICIRFQTVSNHKRLLSRHCALLALAVGWILHTAATLQGESLSQAWACALASNPNLAAANLETIASHQELDARGSERYPDVRLYSSYNVRSDEPSFRVQSPLPGFGSFAFPYAQNDSAAAGAQVKVPLYTSGRISHTIHVIAKRADAAECEAAWNALKLRFSVAQAYLAILRSQRNLEVLESELESLRAHEANLAKSHAKQQVHRNDLMSAQVATAGAQQKRLREITDLYNHRGTYNRLLGRQVLQSVVLDELELPALTMSLEGLIHLAWCERPDLRRLTFLAESRSHEAQRLEATARPQVTAAGTYDYEENRFNTPQALAAASIIVDWNAFDGGRARSAAAAEQSRAASLMRRCEDLKSQISLDLLNAWNDRYEANQRIFVAQQKLEQTEEHLRIIEHRFGTGNAIQSDILDAQSWRSQAQRDIYHAHYDRTLAELRLRYAAGILGREHLGNISARTN